MNEGSCHGIACYQPDVPFRAAETKKKPPLSSATAAVIHPFHDRAVDLLALALGGHNAGIEITSLVIDVKAEDLRRAVD